MLNRRNFLKLGTASAAAGLAGQAILAKSKELPPQGSKYFSPLTGVARRPVPSAWLQGVTG